MALATRITELAGCRVPVQQAPMGSVPTPALAAASASVSAVEPAAQIIEAWLAAARPAG